MKNIGITHYFLLGSLIMILVSGCRKDNIEPHEPWRFYTPDYFPEPVYKFENNEESYAKFSLGKDLFFDPILSIDNTISCASCHGQVHYFADHNTAFSTGVNGAIGKRNSPSITNLAWQPAFMWDGGVNHIEIFSVAPITNPLEMKETISNVLLKLNSDEDYKEKFLAAFGTSEITDQMMLRALTVYMTRIISDKSKYDQYRRGEVELSTDELAGLNLFKTNCASCHTEPLFTNHSYRNNGLDSTFSDLGRGLISQNPDDNGKFKVPSLRNVEKTYPYMHDGRFFSLEQVLDHYSSGIISSPTLDPTLASGIPLTDLEKSQIISFLKTLTDYELLSEKILDEGHH